jgi:hypothetical protein
MIKSIYIFLFNIITLFIVVFVLCRENKKKENQMLYFVDKKIIKSK